MILITSKNNLFIVIPIYYYITEVIRTSNQAHSNWKLNQQIKIKNYCRVYKFIYKTVKYIILNTHPSDIC
jgi:ABC-type maltose transport system permease subunit